MLKMPDKSKYGFPDQLIKFLSDEVYQGKAFVKEILGFQLFNRGGIPYSVMKDLLAEIMLEMGWATIYVAPHDKHTYDFYKGALFIGKNAPLFSPVVRRSPCATQTSSAAPPPASCWKASSE